MGFPSRGAEACYRNPYTSELAFLDARHTGKYKVFNLCGEPGRQYDPCLFYGRAATYGWEDHEACPFEMVSAVMLPVADQNNEHTTTLRTDIPGMRRCCRILGTGSSAHCGVALQSRQRPHWPAGLLPALALGLGWRPLLRNAALRHTAHTKQ